MGLTGMAYSAAPGTSRVRGREPMLMDSRSKGTGGRPDDLKGPVRQVQALDLGVVEARPGKLGQGPQIDVAGVVVVMTGHIAGQHTRNKGYGHPG